MAHISLGSALGLGFGVAQSLMQTPWLIALLFVALTSLVFMRGRRNTAMTTQLQRAALTIQHGHLAQAEAELEGLLDRSTFQPVLHALAVYHLGLCRQALGHLEQATALFIASHRSGWLRSQTFFCPALLSALATSYTLLDQPEKAEDVLSELRGIRHAESSLQMARAEFVLDCRRARWDAITAHRVQGLLLAAEFPSWQQRRLAALSAYALTHHPPSESQTALSTRLLARARHPVGPRLETMSRHWPELEDFFLSQSLQEGGVVDEGSTLIKG